MADGDEIDRDFHNLTLELTNVSSALTTQGIAANIPKFDGNPKFFSINLFLILISMLILPSLEIVKIQNMFINPLDILLLEI